MLACYAPIQGLFFVAPIFAYRLWRFFTVFSTRTVLFVFYHRPKNVLVRRVGRIAARLGVRPAPRSQAGSP
jgi:hypothetical protein